MADYTNGHSNGHRNGNGNGITNGNGNGNGYGRGPKLLPVPPSGLADQLPPHNLEVEMSVLGALMLDNDALHDVIPILRVEDFYRDSHQVIYRAIRDLYEATKPVDTYILIDELTRRGQFEAIGGDETMSKILASVNHAANAVFHAQIVRQKSVTRQLIEISHQLQRDGYSNNFTADQLLESAERQVFAIAEDQMAGETKDLSDVIVEAMSRISTRAEDTHAVTGLSTGYFDLDELTGGLQPAQLVILAARPSMGKTALAMNICEHVICELNKAVLFVSLEMGELELVERLLSSRARVDGHRLRTGKGLGQAEMVKLGKGYNELNGKPLFIDSTPARTMLQITANARRLKMRKDIGLIVLDYIQLVDADESRDSRQEQIAKISRRLKQLAREMQVPVIALSQLNRGVENREDRRPRMADLRESGAIEQDADLILLLHRPEYYDANDQPGVAELIVAKNRTGATDTVKMVFLKNLTRFENMSQTADPIHNAF